MDSNYVHPLTLLTTYVALVRCAPLASPICAPLSSMDRYMYGTVDCPRGMERSNGRGTPCHRPSDVAEADEDGEDGRGEQRAEHERDVRARDGHVLAAARLLVG